MDDISHAVARNLRALRTERGISVSDLARRSGVAKGTISKLERGIATNPTVETLWALADVIGVHLSELIAIPRPTSVVERAVEAQWVDGEGLAARILDRLSNREVHDVAEVRFEPECVRQAGPHVLSAVAHVFLIEGELTVGPEGATVKLTAGDYGTFPADVAHTYIAQGGSARALVIMTMPRSQRFASDGYVNGSLTSNTGSTLTTE